MRRLWLITKWTVASVAALIGIAVLSVSFILRGKIVHPIDAAVTADKILAESTAPQVLRVWPGKAPGSEGWTQHETELGSGAELIVRNVVDPTLTAYFPPAGKANGAAMIVCPGGGFHILSVANEGVEVARYLNSIGVTAFVLRYRLTETNAAFLVVLARRLRTPEGLRPVVREIGPLALVDGQQAMRIVRANAAKWGIDRQRIGMIGFSAGGHVALNVAMHHDAETVPNFVAAMYPLPPEPFAAPGDSIPLFEVCAKDDPLLPPAQNCIRVDQAWRAAGLPAEIHIFDKGGHGFGMRKQNLPIDNWPELLRQWLDARGELQAAH